MAFDDQTKPDTLRSPEPQQVSISGATSQAGFVPLGELFNQLPDAEHFFVHRDGAYLSMSGGVFFGEPDNKWFEESRVATISLDDLVGRELATLEPTTRAGIVAQLSSTKVVQNYLVAHDVSLSAIHSDPFRYSQIIASVVTQIRERPDADVLLARMEQLLRSEAADHRVILPENLSLVDVLASPGSLTAEQYQAVYSILNGYEAKLGMDEVMGGGDAYHDTLREAGSRAMDIEIDLGQAIMGRAIERYPSLLRGVDDRSVRFEAMDAAMALGLVGAEPQGRNEAAADYKERIAMRGFEVMNTQAVAGIASVNAMSSDPQFVRDFQRAQGLIMREMGRNQEAQYLVNEHGTLFVIDMNRDVRLDSRYGMTRDTQAPENHDHSASGTADGGGNIINIDFETDAWFVETWREEVSHMMDYRVREDAEIVGFYGRTNLSGLMLTDAAVNGDLARIDAAIGTGLNGATYDGFTRVADRYGLRTDSDPQLGRDTAYYSMLGDLRYIVTLDSAIYNGVAASRDGDELNFNRDTETMVKFHRLRMRLEDQNAGASVPDYYASSSPALELLSTLSPEITQIYRSQWLPMLNAATSIQDEPMREAVLKALAVQNGYGVPAEGFGVMTPADVAAIQEAAQSGAFNGTVAIRNRDGIGRDELLINGEAVPVQFTPEMPSGNRTIVR